MNMLNGDEAMSPAEFAKLMGAYPQPAENPLPAYGGYMDNSPANFAWVQNNDYFGAEGDREILPLIISIDTSYSTSQQGINKAYRKMAIDAINELKPFAVMILEHKNNVQTVYSGDAQSAIQFINDENNLQPSGGTAPMGRIVEAISTLQGNKMILTDGEWLSVESAIRMAEGEKKNCGCGQDPCITYGAEAWSETDQYTIEYLMGYHTNVSLTDRVREMVNDEDIDLDTLTWFINNMEIPFGDREEALEIITEAKSAETFEAPYGGAGSLMDIGKETPLADFTGQELAESSAIHGDFDQASLNYSGHQNLEVRAEGDLQGYSEGQYPDDEYITTDTRKGVTFVEGAFEVVQERENREDEAVMVKFELPVDDFIYRLQGSSMTNYTGFITIERDIYDAEMEELTENMVEVTNRFHDSVGRIHVEDVEGDIDDIESVDVSLEDMDGDMIASFTMSDEYIPEELDDYLQDQYATETKKGMWVGLASLAIGTLAWLNRDSLTSSVKRVFNNETQEMLENDPELIENPEIGNLDPAQYEELVVQSTGYAVDVIPVGLDGSFMGSRFAALPTERYVEYNDPGIGAHTDIAMNRDEIYLEPEMAMVQASENVIKEAQAPGQSPYNSITGEENPDFDYRVIKETHPISLDPAVKPFIPQSMAGYTGNANTPPSVMNKMFNIGVLGQTPAFVPGSSDMGANHFGSRNATPNTLGLGGVVGGPLSDQVNASYTDGTTSMSLAQWSIENTVSQTSDTEAVVIDRSSGLMKRVRRV